MWSQVGTVRGKSHLQSSRRASWTRTCRDGTPSARSRRRAMVGVFESIIDNSRKLVPVRVPVFSGVSLISFPHHHYNSLSAPTPTAPFLSLRIAIDSRSHPRISPKRPGDRPPLPAPPGYTHTMGALPSPTTPLPGIGHGGLLPKPEQPNPSLYFPTLARRFHRQEMCGGTEEGLSSPFPKDNP